MAAVVEDLKTATGTFDRLKYPQHSVRELTLCEICSKRNGVTFSLYRLAIMGDREREKLTGEQYHGDIERLLERGQRSAVFGDPTKQPFA